TVPTQANQRALSSAPSTTTMGPRNGAIRMVTGVGSARVPSHHVGCPSCTLAFHTADQPSTTPIHVTTITRRQPLVSSPGRGAATGWASPSGPNPTGAGGGGGRGPGADGGCVGARRSATRATLRVDRKSVVEGKRGGVGGGRGSEW